MCNARLSKGRGYCRAQPVKGKLRCKFHGGAATGPRTPEGKARTVEAMAAGRARWLAQMRELKARGVIAKIPGGRRPSSQPRKTGDKIVDTARTVLAERRAELMAETAADDLLEIGQANLAEEKETALPVPVEWDRMPPTAKLLTLTVKSLDTINSILDRPDEADATPALKLKLLSIKKDAALSVLATQVKVDENQLRARRSGDRLARLLEEIRKASKQESPLSSVTMEGTAEPPT